MRGRPVAILNSRTSMLKRIGIALTTATNRSTQHSPTKVSNESREGRMKRKERKRQNKDEELER